MGGIASSEPRFEVLSTLSSAVPAREDNLHSSQLVPVECSHGSVSSVHSSSSLHGSDLPSIIS